MILPFFKPLNGQLVRQVKDSIRRQLADSMA